MFVYGADFFLYRPGLVLTVLGVALTLPLSLRAGDARARSCSRSTGCSSGSRCATLGLQCIYLGILAQIFFDYSGDITKRWFARFPYTRTVRASPRRSSRSGVGLRARSSSTTCATTSCSTPDARVNHLGVTGLLLMIAGFMTFTFTLLLHSTAVVVWRR